VPAEVRLYGPLFDVPDPTDVEEGKSFLDHLDPASLEVVPDARVEPGLADAGPGHTVQFERLGYFCVDRDSSAGRLVFNRTVTLRDTWAKIVKKGQ